MQNNNTKKAFCENLRLQSETYVRQKFNQVRVLRIINLYNG